MTTEESVINWLEARGVDCDDARNAMRHVMGYDVSGMDDIASEYRKSCRALCVVAAMESGKVGIQYCRNMPEGKRWGAEAGTGFQFGSTPWLALVALVEADNA